MRSSSETTCRRSALVAAVVVLAWGGLARAQSCVRESEASTRCRILLSQPRAFTVQAGVSLAGARGRGPATLTIEVDGRPCLQAALVPLSRLSGRCTAALPPGEHAVVAAIATRSGRPLGVGVELLPNARLAALPREAGDLFPERR